MIPSPPNGPRQRWSEGLLPAPLARRNRREPLTLSVKYRGGAEAWYEIKARGRTYRVPGHRALHDVMELINEGGCQPRE